jgi:hypothetical protein
MRKWLRYRFMAQFVCEVLDDKDDGQYLADAWPKW